MQEKVEYFPDDIELYLEFKILLNAMNTDTKLYNFLLPLLKELENKIQTGIQSIYNKEGQIGSHAWISFIADLPGVHKPDNLPTNG